MVPPPRTLESTVTHPKEKNKTKENRKKFTYRTLERVTPTVTVAGSLHRETESGGPGGDTSPRTALPPTTRHCYGVPHGAPSGSIPGPPKRSPGGGTGRGSLSTPSDHAPVHGVAGAVGAPKKKCVPPEALASPGVPVRPTTYPTSGTITHKTVALIEA